MDRDLQSIQEARELAIRARDAQRIWAEATQEQVDRVCAAMADAAYHAAERLGRDASEETGYGVPDHKTLKNQFGSKNVWESIRDVKTVGVVRHDEARKLYEIAWPMGVVAALTPSTNPTSTVMVKTLISVKARNAIVVAPHPTARKCCFDTAQIMAQAAEDAGAPPGLVNCMQHVSLPGTQELMRHKYTALILATGGSDMVRAAHSVGKPAYGVGPGNVPAYVDRSANLERAARYIVASKAFDYSVICATEQAVIADKPIAGRLKELMIAEGAYFMNPAECNAMRKLLFHPNGAINVQTVGKSPQHLAAMAGIRAPESARILVAPLNKVGRDEPLSREKLTTVLGWYEADGWEPGCDRCIDLIQFGGRGHSLIIHAEDEKVILAFGLEKPVFRIGVNTMGTLGTIGLTTGVMPSMTLGSGGVGGSITGDNITVYHMFNVKRLAFETTPPPAKALRPGTTPAGRIHGPTPQEIDAIVQDVVASILKT
ncbi:MAG: aldehyde dehydrogenase family protein [Anaerolineales bacterium]|nr:aldehyde dehydrogenase family protein [Anaerolineales bacterium]